MVTSNSNLLYSLSVSGPRLQCLTNSYFVLLISATPLQFRTLLLLLAKSEEPELKKLDKLEFNNANALKGLMHSEEVELFYYSPILGHTGGGGYIEGRYLLTAFHFRSQDEID